MSLALYRKHRPAAFAELIGQEHVTEPLTAALRAGRLHHAYLFSGPRGCGKTSSARILARSLNCVDGPTPTPCGQCESCVALAPNGPGTLDVIEIDAASHNGVDDARDLRERAMFAPVASTYKVYIVDEAHMVTPQAFNALLKVVEEPPEHLVFVFATTEPDKVIATIKSRTHHYPFRLVPPARLRDHLAAICEREGARVDPHVLPLVVRAGAGSVRDALSVLDQLLAGAGRDGVTYAQAIALLGFTDAELLDEVVDALAASDGGALFSIVDRVVQSGHDPRRFAQDVLERLRDLLVLRAVPEAGETGLLDCPADQLDRMRGQAARFGPLALTRAAEVLSAGLTEMKGATSPRLLLELVCARALLPGAYGDEASLLARVERLERRTELTTRASAPGAAAPGASTPAPVPDVAAPPPPPAAPAPPAPPPAPDAPGPAGPASTAVDAIALRRAWPEILDKVARMRRTVWLSLRDHAQVVGADGRTLTLAFDNAGNHKWFTNSPGAEVISAAIRDYLGVEMTVTAVVRAPAGAPGGQGTGTGTGNGQAGAPQRPGVPDEPEPPDPTAAPEPELDPVALVQRDLGATVIGEVDGE